MILKEFLEKHLDDYIVIEYPTGKTRKGYGKDLFSEDDDIWNVYSINTECDYCDCLITVY